MKIAIISDIHLGYERFEEDALAQAREAFGLAARLADAVLIPGDVFDKRYPKPEVIAQAINLFRELSKNDWGARIVDFKGHGKIYTDVPIVAIPGTHERIAEGKDNALRLLSLAGLLADTSEATTVLQKGDEKVAIFGLGGLSEEMVAERLKKLDARPIGGMLNIFMFHQSIYELLPFSKHFMTYNDIPKGFDLYVCGHIHNRVETTVHGKKLLIPGSTVITQLKDKEQEQKGFLLLDTADLRHEFMYIKSRPFIEKSISFSCATPAHIIEKCEKEISDIMAKEEAVPIIRLKLTGTVAEGFSGTDIQARPLQSKYLGRAYIYIDQTKLVSPDLESKIDGIREGKIGDMPVKELGTITLMSKMKDLGIDKSIDISGLFNILSSQTNREKMLKEASEFLFKV